MIKTEVTLPSGTVARFATNGTVLALAFSDTVIIIPGKVKDIPNLIEALEYVSG